MRELDDREKAQVSGAGEHGRSPLAARIIGLHRLTGLRWTSRGEAISHDMQATRREAALPNPDGGLLRQLTNRMRHGWR